MKYIIVLTLVAAFCLPVYADVLVFQTRTSGQQLNVDSKIVEKKSQHGYLVIVADLSDPNSVSISEAYHLHYEAVAGRKIQRTTILNPNNMEIILVDYRKSKKMVLRWFDDPTGTYTVVCGSAALKDIGGISRYISTGISGSSVWRELDFRTGSGTIKMTLNITATKLANSTSQTAVSIIEGYSRTLASQGYSDE